MSTPWAVRMGVDASGESVSRDLTKAPHLLIAGTSGSGKSIAMHALLSGLVAGGSPADTTIRIYDVKRVEFGLWRAAPHVTAVITDRDDIVADLQEMAREMDRRYAAMERGDVRDIAEWIGTPKQVPYLFLFCDEVADLTMSGRDKESKIRSGLVLGALTRIAQLGRAAGIVLVLGTQSPRSDVLPGTLRANLGTRWAFRVRTRAESRIALDAPGAESLGAEPGTSLVSWRGAEGTFVQGLYVSRDDCLAIVATAVETYGRRGGVGGSVRPSGGMRGVRGADVWERLPTWAQGIVGLGAVAWVLYCMATFGG